MNKKKLQKLLAQFLHDSLKAHMAKGNGGTLLKPSEIEEVLREDWDNKDGLIEYLEGYAFTPEIKIALHLLNL